MLFILQHLIQGLQIIVHGGLLRDNYSVCISHRDKILPALLNFELLDEQLGVTFVTHRRSLLDLGLQN